MKRVELAGQRFGRLLVSRLSRRAARRIEWLCRCDCGIIKWIPTRHLRASVTRSCGCLMRETGPANRTHGHASRHSPEYQAWAHAVQRCTNPRASNYAEYGGRGITICDRWRYSFADFLADMGPRPPGHSIDRIDNDGHYEPGNCRWATASQQRYNQRARRVRPRPTCHLGHPFDEHNTYRAPVTGHRQCRLCHTIRERDRRAAERLGGAAAETTP